jgi:hypothetical protein
MNGLVSYSKFKIPAMKTMNTKSEDENKPALRAHGSSEPRLSYFSERWKHHFAIHAGTQSQQAIVGEWVEYPVM